MIWVFGKGTCDSICALAGQDCDMSGVEGLDRDSCTDIFVNGQYTTVGSPVYWTDGRPGTNDLVAWSEEWKQTDNNQAADGSDNSNPGQSPCLVEFIGRLWYLNNDNIRGNVAGWSKCDAEMNWLWNNQLCSCV